ncbi:unnamed protein product [Amoebophrya sp. A25]|nr:unnamed protein product [Amoebophrya sp. A25]|eukprot:GSA25T00005001001.1
MTASSSTTTARRTGSSSSSTSTSTSISSSALFPKMSNRMMSSSSSSSSSNNRSTQQLTPSQRREALLEAEAFLEERMKGDLRDQIERTRRIAAEIKEVKKQQLQLQEIQRKHRLMDIADQDFEMETLVNLGISTVMAKARVFDTRRVFVECGLGFLVEMELDKAVAFLKEKEKHLTKDFDLEVEKSTKIKAKVHEMMYYMQHLQQIGVA